MNDTNKRRLAAVLAAAALLGAAGAQAEPRGERHERARYATPHWVFDDRYHHNHYYPAVGYAVDVLPPGNIAVRFRDGDFWFHSGVWYRHAGPRFVVVRPPVGVLVPVLPPAYSVVYYAGVPYYYANDVYYVQGPSGYTVAEPPAVAQDSAPPPPAPQPPPQTVPSGNWYYCESSRAYYPYVRDCPAGWQRVSPQPHG